MKKQKKYLKLIIVLTLIVSIFLVFSIEYTEIIKSKKINSNLDIEQVEGRSSYSFSKNFSYTGKIQEWVVPRSGKYRISVVGAAGGGAGISGGGASGATIKGYINVNKGDKYYIAVGGEGKASFNGAAGGWNGGGSSSGYGGSGGGATSIYNTLIGDGQLSNYENNKQAILVTAGGGGGIYYDLSYYDEAAYLNGGFYDTEVLGTHSTYYNEYGTLSISTAYHRVKNNWLCGRGGFNEGESSYYLSSYSDIKTGYKTGATRTSGYAFGRGQDSLGRYTGAGGGGYYGGYSVDTSKYEPSVGGGGSGYYNESFISDLTLSNTDSGKTGVQVEYIPQTSQLTIITSGHATYNGQTGDIVLTGDYGDTFDLSKITPNKGSTITGFQLESGDGSISGNKYTFNKKNTVISLKTRSNIGLTTSIYEGVMFLEASSSDNTDKKYTLYESVDGNNFKELSSDEYNFADAESRYFNYTGAVQEYTTKYSGYYKLVTAGGGGNSTPGSSTKGSVASGTVYLDKGTKLYVYVGGREKTFNGGGTGGGRTQNPNAVFLNSTNGSGATDFRLIKSTASDGWSGNNSLLSRIITAGGGGGARRCVGRNFNGATALNSYWDSTSNMYGAYGVDSEYSNGVYGQGSSDVYSYSQLTDSGDRGYSVSGGGGGGWYGGKTQSFSLSGTYNGIVVEERTVLEIH